MLEASDLYAWYGEGQVLHGINLKVGKGQRVAILGRNGAGKTTLMKCVMNGGPRVAGRVTWEGQELGTLPAFKRARLGLALVPEDRRIFEHVTVVENIEMARYAAGPGRAAVPVNEIFERFTMLGPLASRLGGQLSGGQQQMLAVARAVAARPRLLLLDEPTEGLAPVIVEQLARDVRRTCEESGIGLMLAEQNIWFARQCTDYVYILSTGCVAFEGDWAHFDSNRETAQRFLAV
ncbi:MAG: ATP-binding cassette domain-containing protein [Burkholderiales bacterium]